MNTFEQNLIKATPLSIDHSGKFEIRYMHGSDMGNFFGYAFKQVAFVKAELPRPVKRFVTKHELYHLNDRRTWLGWIGSETRANVACGARDPLGFLLTAAASLRPYRLRKYWKLLRGNPTSPRA